MSFVSPILRLIYHSLVASLILLIMPFSSINILFSCRIRVRTKRESHGLNQFPIYVHASLVAYSPILIHAKLGHPSLASKNKWCQFCPSYQPCLVSLVNLENMFKVLFQIMPFVEMGFLLFWFTLMHGACVMSCLL